jgi:hypothetical protein
VVNGGSVWVTKACQLFLVPSRSSNPPLYPSKGLWARERALTPPFPLLSIWAHIWVPWGVGGASRVLMMGYGLSLSVLFTMNNWMFMAPNCKMLLRWSISFGVQSYTNVPRTMLNVVKFCTPLPLKNYCMNFKHWNLMKLIA